MGKCIEIGQRVTISDQTFLISAILPEFGDIRLEGKGGILRQFDARDFYNKVTEGQIRFPDSEVAETGVAATSTQLAAADYRLSVINYKKKLDAKPLSHTDRNSRLNDYCQTYHGKKRAPNRKTLNGWIRAYKQFGYEGLIPAFHKRGGCGWEKKSKAREIAKKMLCEYFMKDDRVNITSVTQLINDVLREIRSQSGEPEKISRKSVVRLLMRLPRDLVKEGRLDPRTAELYLRQAVRQFDVKQPFEILELDSTTLSVICRDKEGVLHSEITMYALVCARTSYPVAIYVTPGAASEFGIYKLLEFFLTPKDENFKKVWGITTNWVMPCAIKSILVDNHSSNASNFVKALVRRAGIEVLYARAKRGDDKPHVEAFISVVENWLISKLPGATKSQEKFKKDRIQEAMEEACYSSEEVYKEIVRFVADLYIHQPEVDLGFRHKKPTTIHEAMQADLQNFMPLPPIQMSYLKKLALEINRAERKAQHYGVDFKGFQFHSTQFAQLHRRLRLKTVELVFNPMDCCQIHIINPETGGLIPAYNKIKDMPQISFELAAEIRKAYDKDPDSLTGVNYSIAAQMAKYKEDTQRGRRENRKIKAANKLQRASEKKSRSEELQRTLSEAAPTTHMPPISPALSPARIRPAPTRHR